MLHKLINIIKNNIRGKRRRTEIIIVKISEYNWSKSEYNKSISVDTKKTKYIKLRNTNTNILFLIKNPSSIQKGTKIIKQHPQNVSRVYLLPNPNDGFLLSGMLIDVTNPLLRK